MPDINSKPSLRELEGLPLIEACIKESLRVVCPPRGRLPRNVPSEGWHYRGTFFVPGVGTVLSVYQKKFLIY
jgi:hypothetical protein